MGCWLGRFSAEGSQIEYNIIRERWAKDCIPTETMRQGGYWRLWTRCRNYTLWGWLATRASFCRTLRTVSTKSRSATSYGARVLRGGATTANTRCTYWNRYSGSRTPTLCCGRPPTLTRSWGLWSQTGGSDWTRSATSCGSWVRRIWTGPTSSWKNRMRTISSAGVRSATSRWCPAS